MAKTRGQINYEAYCACRDWKAFNGDSLPQWQSVELDIKAAWEMAALAVVAPQRSEPRQ